MPPSPQLRREHFAIDSFPPGAEFYGANLQPTPMLEPYSLHERGPSEADSTPPMSSRTSPTTTISPYSSIWDDVDDYLRVDHTTFTDPALDSSFGGGPSKVPYGPRSQLFGMEEWLPSWDAGLCLPSDAPIASINPGDLKIVESSLEMPDVRYAQLLAPSPEPFLFTQAPNSAARRLHPRQDFTPEQLELLAIAMPPALPTPQSPPHAHSPPPRPVLRSRRESKPSTAAPPPSPPLQQQQASSAPARKQPKSPLAGKMAHNMIEKRYRTNLNDKIAALRVCVPGLRGAGGAGGDDDGGDERKMNKATVLVRAAEYIAALEEQVRELQDEVGVLRSL